MALVQVDNGYFNYMALAADIVDNKIAGASRIGGIVYISDGTPAYKIILQDLTLDDFVAPA